MSQLDELNILISVLRKELHYLITQKKDLLDPEILAVSKMLDKVLYEITRS